MTAANEPRFGRMIPAMVTPFDENLELDLDQVRALARRLVDGGSDALIINGTTGESPTVFYPQKMKLFEAVLSEVKGEVPVIANVGDNCTADTGDVAPDGQKLGGDACMLGVPYYNKPPQEGLYQHFKTIADAVDLPIILYNIPGRTGINMTPETTLRLANDCDNIVSIKEESGDLNQVAEYNTALMDLESGACDAIAMDIGVANYQVNSRKNPDDYKILDKEISSEQYAVGFKKGNTELKDKVQKTLDEMAEDGTVDKIAEKYADYGVPGALCIGKNSK